MRARARRKREKMRTAEQQTRPDVAIRQRAVPAAPPPEVERLWRRRSGRIVAGVSGGIADHLGIPVLWVRAVFAVAAAFGGAGVVAYGMFWIFVPQAAGRDSDISGRERQQGVGLLILGIGLTALVSALGTLPTWLLTPFAVALVGAAVIWREADESQRRRWREGARSGVAGALLGGGRRGSLIRIVAGAVLVVAGIVSFLAGRIPLGDLQFALTAVLATLIGTAVLTIPWWMRLVSDLNTERASRIRSQERAEIAAHLHDSVLQTLALIQKQADSSREVRRLARGQERELRNWLYGPDGYGRSGGTGPVGSGGSGGTAAGTVPGTGEGAQVEAEPRTLAAALAKACGEVEDTFAIKVQQVVVGDCDVDDRHAAQLAAAREAIVNSAKHAGVAEVSVYAEVEPDQVSIYVRDRGAGFDPDSVPGDRHGLADSIRGRMERNGGQVRVRTAPGAGTEVQMDMPRAGAQ
ncbi:PspC domain-containing protein [Saccharopolyspora erythraea]|uniref:ATP-binding protein n=1 Tax=Saccharopolyspora erythraea TaxID=1836 RepID=UPI001BA4D993|nr:ATP-binding protein [Saccharopolyspora erythraea]QUH05072.1 PspC domain-containing protein [Saccharopolyspora erythraea]